ncbi:hypothetical protein ACH79_39550 [Bradyrhizobium sp. CCBAU 051011]|nr:hypothetical protein ACH79_39550 [Bradyrhizobium sp. CCBAU 051011]
MVRTGHQFSPERLEELRRIYREVSGEEITAAEASDIAHRSSRPIDCFPAICTTSPRSLLLCHHLRLKSLRKTSDVVQDALTVVGLHVAQIMRASRPSMIPLETRSG